jgi:ABC-type sugar transport system ATPase subunit
MPPTSPTIRKSPATKRDRRRRRLPDAVGSLSSNKEFVFVMVQPVVLSASEVTKIFGATVALDGVSFDLHVGEIHGLIGENGAGKSTLTRLLSGVHRPDGGKLWFDGQILGQWDPEAALAAGIVTIHQDLNLIETMTVAQNIFLNDEERGRFGLDEAFMNCATDRLLDELGITVRARDVVAELPADQRKMIQLARAVRLKPRVLLLDEPTSSLTQDEVGVLVAQVHRIAQRGVAVLYISHYLDEVFAHTDRLTILRDGRSVWSGPTAAITKDDAIKLMIGGTLSAPPARKIQKHVPKDVPALRVKGLSLGERLRDVSFDVQRGEIFGIGGLAGAGLGELARAIFGDPAFRPDTGSIEKDGVARDWRDVSDAIANGLALVTNDRHRTGALVDFSIADNVALPSLAKFSNRLGILRGRAINETALEAMRTLSIKATGPSVLLSNLSGGNQQKVMLAKWFATDPDVLILDEPTLGVDIGAKHAIKELIRARAAAGTAVLLLTSELDDIAELADRAIVVFRGAVCARLDATELSYNALLHAVHSPKAIAEYSA